MTAESPGLPLTRPSFDGAELARVAACLDSGWVTQGPMVAEFERRVANYQCARHGLAVTSCTAALQLAVVALGLGPGDEVIVPAFTWVTSANAAEYAGARAVFADIDLATYNIEVAALAAAITPRTKAVVAVHLFGRAAPMQEIQAITAPRGIRVIEDAACAISTCYNGRPVGSIGDIGCFSFHPRKIVTTGEGGLVTTDDDELARRVRYLRNHGVTGLPPEDTAGKYPWTMNLFDELGYNLRLSDIQAAVGLAQLEKLDSLVAERKARAARYSQHLHSLNDVVLPLNDDAGGHTYQSYVVRIVEGGRKRRNTVMQALQERGIQTRPGTHAVHRLGYYRKKYMLRSEDFTNASLAEDTTITLPIFPGMTDQDQDRVIAALEVGLARLVD